MPRDKRVQQMKTDEVEERLRYVMSQGPWCCCVLFTRLSLWAGNSEYRVGQQRVVVNEQEQPNTANHFKPHITCQGNIHIYIDWNLVWYLCINEWDPLAITSNLGATVQRYSCIRDCLQGLSLPSTCLISKFPPNDGQNVIFQCLQPPNQMTNVKEQVWLQVSTKGDLG